MKIDTESYKIDEINYNKIKSKKKQIVLSSSLRRGNNHLIRLEHKEFGKTKRWNTYTITRDGVIYEHYDPIYSSNFLNIENIDKQSISVVLENMGHLVKNNDIYSNWINEECEKELIAEKKWNIYQYWEVYTDKQIKSCVELCKFLCDKFKIKNNLIEFSSYHKDIHKYNGIIYQSNCIENSDDVNPFLEIKFNQLK